MRCIFCVSPRGNINNDNYNNDNGVRPYWWILRDRVGESPNQSATPKERITFPKG